MATTRRTARKGAVAGNAIGTYLHGSLLPKNPHLADEIIRSRARSYRPRLSSLAPLDDSR